METNNRYCYPYPRPAVTTDSVVFGYENRQLYVLLIQRKSEPYRGEWAFPGGFLEPDEDADTCARRELKEETGLDGIPLEQLRTFSAVNRDPRGRTVSIAYMAVVNKTAYHPQGADDAADARWFPLAGLPQLAFDHAEIMQAALERLRHEYARYSDNATRFTLA
ncbi:MAG: NUDIX hydrolase [Parabacteroides sp.]|nr:NUDIX hydrolase [Parabacteroides sp.]